MVSTNKYKALKSVSVRRNKVNKNFWTVFSSFRLVETDFLSSGKSIFLFRAFLKLLKFGDGNSCIWKLIFWLVGLIFSHFSDTRSSEGYFSSNVNAFLNESSNLNGGHAFSVLWKPISFSNFFLYKWKQSLKLLETHIFGERFSSITGFSL